LVLKLDILAPNFAFLDKKNSTKKLFRQFSDSPKFRARQLPRLPNITEYFDVVLRKQADTSSWGGDLSPSSIQPPLSSASFISRHYDSDDNNNNNNDYYYYYKHSCRRLASVSMTTTMTTVRAVRSFHRTAIPQVRPGPPTRSRHPRTIV